MRRTLVLLAAVGLVLAAAAPASAGTLNVANACFWSVNSTWQAQNVDLTGTAAPSPLAPGSGFTLTGASIHSRLPEWLELYTDAFLKPGANELPTKVWVALAGDNTAQGVQVFALETIARTTVTPDPAGGQSKMTPIDVTIPIPDSAWTAGGVGSVGLRQAGPGTLPPIPGGRNGATVTPKGSVFMSTTTPNGLLIQIDCQPGTNAPNKLSAIPATAGPFEAVPVQVDAPALPAPKPAPAVALRTTKLKASGRTVKVSVSCTAADCKGALTLKAGSKLLAAKRTYAVKPGTNGTVKLTLTKAAQRSLKKKKSIKVSLAITADGGKTLTKKLTLR